MKLYANDLAVYLDKNILAPVYIVSGDEPLQMGETCDLIRHAAHANGYTEREVLDIDKAFDWGHLHMSANSLSLFAQRRIIEVRLPTGKPGDKGGKALRAYVDHMPDDTILLVISGKIDKQTQKAKWYCSLDSAGVSVQVWPIEPRQLPAWVSRRMQQKGMNATREAVSMIVDRVEGNLLAAVQEIEKLRLIYGATDINADHVLDAVVDSTRFDIFTLVDTALQGNAARCTRVLDGLRGEGFEPVLILWAITKEIRALETMAQALETGSTMDQVLTKARVWPKRKPLIEEGLKHHRAAGWQRMLRTAGSIDRIIKGMAPGNVWDELLQLCLMIGGVRLFPFNSP